MASGLGTESLSRLSTTEHTEHTETNSLADYALLPWFRCVPWFPAFLVFRDSMLFGDKSEYMVAAPVSRVGHDYSTR